jgi:lipopolysaccharide biosynthesis regulator YciM
MPSLIVSVRALAALGRMVARILGAAPLAPPVDPAVAELVRRGDDAVRLGRPEDARRLYREALERDRHHVAALRGLRDLAVNAGDWREALDAAERLVGAVPGPERDADATALAAIHYELGRAELAQGRAASGLGHLRSALRADRAFVPAALALGDAYEAGGDHREAIRTWERAVEAQPALPLLARLEAVYRREGRPSRMIALYRAALDRVPDDPSLALALGRVYFELEMLDEAADQLEKLEVRAPEVPSVHAYLGAVFERRGESRDAFEEYRRALRLAGAFEWPHRCSACGAGASGWHERCRQCRRWNSLRPADAR